MTEEKRKMVKKEEKKSKPAGKSFDDLTKEEMDQLQGQGEKKRGAVWDFITSRGEFTCR